MSNLTDISEQLEKLPIDGRKAITALIDIKTEDDMDKVLTKLDAMQSKFDAKFDAIESKFDAKFDALDSKISNTRWFVLGTIALAGVLLRISTTI